MTLLTTLAAMMAVILAPAPAQTGPGVATAQALALALELEQQLELELAPATGAIGATGAGAGAQVRIQVPRRDQRPTGPTMPHLAQRQLQHPSPRRRAKICGTYRIS